MDRLGGLPGGAPLAHGASGASSGAPYADASPDWLADVAFAEELGRLLAVGLVDAAIALCEGREMERVHAALERARVKPERALAFCRRMLGSLIDNRDRLDGRIAALGSRVAVFAGAMLGGHLADLPDAEMSLRRSRVFEVSAASVWAAAGRVRAEDIRSPYLIAPFPRFALALDQPIDAGDGAKVLAVWVDAERDEWRVYARVLIERTRTAESVLTIGIDLPEGVLTAPTIEQSLARLRDAYERTGDAFDEAGARATLDPTGQAVDLAPLARIVIGFALLLNSRAVGVSAATPRDAAVRDEDIDGDGPRARRPRYRVIVPAKRSLRALLASVRRGDDVRDRRPHWVRRHPRTLGDGRVVSVRRHTRGGDPSRYLPLYELRPAVPSAHVSARAPGGLRTELDGSPPAAALERPEDGGAAADGGVQPA